MKADRSQIGAIVKKGFEYLSDKKYEIVKNINSQFNQKQIDEIVESVTNEFIWSTPSYLAEYLLKAHCKNVILNKCKSGIRLQNNTIEKLKQEKLECDKTCYELECKLQDSIEVNNQHSNKINQLTNICNSYITKYDRVKHKYIRYKTAFILMTIAWIVTYALAGFVIFYNN